MWRDRQVRARRCEFAARPSRRRQREDPIDVFRVTMPLGEVLEEDRVLRIADHPLAPKPMQHRKLAFCLFGRGAESHDDAAVGELRSVPDVVTLPYATLDQDLIDQGLPSRAILDRHTRDGCPNPLPDIEEGCLRTRALMRSHEIASMRFDSCWMRSGRKPDQWCCGS